jgi:peptidyl-prolyl cis-trans isomerase B (cyclophilin B)
VPPPGWQYPSPPYPGQGYPAWGPPGGGPPPSGRSDLQWLWLLIAVGGVLLLCVVCSFVGFAVTRSPSFKAAIATAEATFSPAPPGNTGCNLHTHVCDKPKMTVDANKAYTATIKTAKGNIVIALDVKDSPIAVNNFVYLAQQGFYNGLTFHRVEHKGQPSSLDGSISTLDLIQGGDPKGNGQGDPGYQFQDEPVVGDYVAGAAAMANSGPNTNGSQFFICTGDNTWLPKQYSLFGHIISGLDVAQKIVAGDKMTSVTITVMTPTPTPTGATPSPTR